MPDGSIGSHLWTVPYIEFPQLEESGFYQELLDSRIIHAVAAFELQRPEGTRQGRVRPSPEDSRRETATPREVEAPELEPTQVVHACVRHPFAVLEVQVLERSQLSQDCNGVLR